KSVALLRFGIAIPEVEGKAAYSDGAAGLPAAVHPVRLDAVLLEIEHLLDIGPCFRGDPHHIEKGTVIAVIVPGLGHHGQKEVPVFLGCKTDILRTHHIASFSPPNTHS